MPHVTRRYSYESGNPPAQLIKDVRGVMPGNGTPGEAGRVARQESPLAAHQT